MTHSFVLKGEGPPVCIPCDELLTVEHVFLFCYDLIEMKERHFTTRSLRMFKNVFLRNVFDYPDNIFDYLKDTVVVEWALKTYHASVCVLKVY